MDTKTIKRNHRPFSLRWQTMLCWACGLLLLSPGMAWAFRVGTLDVQSEPGKPFMAQFAVFPEPGEKMTDLHMGSRSDYRLLGLRYLEASTGFKVTLKGSGKEYRAVVTSAAPTPRENFDLVLTVASDQQTRFPQFSVDWLTQAKSTAPSTAPAPATAPIVPAVTGNTTARAPVPAETPKPSLHLPSPVPTEKLKPLPRTSQVPNETLMAAKPVPAPNEMPKVAKSVPVPNETPMAAKPAPVPNEIPKTAKPAPVPNEMPKAAKPAPVPNEMPMAAKPAPVPNEMPMAAKPAPLPVETPKALARTLGPGETLASALHTQRAAETQKPALHAPVPVIEVVENTSVSRPRVGNSVEGVKGINATSVLKNSVPVAPVPAIVTNVPVATGDPVPLRQMRGDTSEKGQPNLEEMKTLEKRIAQLEDTVGRPVTPVEEIASNTLQQQRLEEMEQRIKNLEQALSVRRTAGNTATATTAASTTTRRSGESLPLISQKAVLSESSSRPEIVADADATERNTRFQAWMERLHGYGNTPWWTLGIVSLLILLWKGYRNGQDLAGDISVRKRPGRASQYRATNSRSDNKGFPRSMEPSFSSAATLYPVSDLDEAVGEVIIRKAAVANEWPGSKS
ncbi:MAG: hypothetical protein HQL65_05290 [Magnetococcales bacterium]|nr:hypothetical protein [Magnetococcales bacterium]